MKTGCFAIFLLLAASTQGSEFVLHKPELSSLSASDRSTWLDALEKMLSPIYSQRGQMGQKLEELESSYLEMDFEGLPRKLKDLENLMIRKPVYPEMAEDYKRLMELKALYAFSTEHLDRRVLTQQIAFFLQEAEFRARMPQALQTQENIFSSENLGSHQDIIVFGRSTKLIPRLPVGRYPYQKFNFPVMEYGEVEISENKIQMKKDGEIFLLKNISDSQLKDALNHTRPASLRNQEVLIHISASKKFSLNAQKPISKIAVSESTKVQPLDLEVFEDSFQDEEAHIQKSIWKSPWLWMAIGALAAGGGYLIYEGTRSESEVRTP